MYLAFVQVYIEICILSEVIVQIKLATRSLTATLCDYLV